MVFSAFGAHTDVVEMWRERRISYCNHCTVVADVFVSDVRLGHEHYFLVCHSSGIYRFVSCGDPSVIHILSPSVLPY